MSTEITVNRIIGPWNDYFQGDEIPTEPVRVRQRNGYESVTEPEECRWEAWNAMSDIVAYRQEPLPEVLENMIDWWKYDGTQVIPTGMVYIKNRKGRIFYDDARKFNWEYRGNDEYDIVEYWPEQTADTHSWLNYASRI